jgi:hypothetical protein
VVGGREVLGERLQLGLRLVDIRRGHRRPRLQNYVIPS